MGTDLTCCSSEAGWGPGRGGPAPCPGFCPGGGSVCGAETSPAAFLPRARDFLARGT